MSFQQHGSSVPATGTVVVVGWLLWFVSAAVVSFQVCHFYAGSSSTASITTTAAAGDTSLLSSLLQQDFSTEEHRILSSLEAEGADEDDVYYNDDLAAFDMMKDNSNWYELGHYVEPQSLLYDLIEGFLYVADAFFIAWIVWGCLVSMGIFPDARLRRNKSRRSKDGRGVFSSLKGHDDNDNHHNDDSSSLYSNETDSRNSMEYGDAHLLNDNDDDYDDDGNVAAQAEREINHAANEYFAKAERKAEQKRHDKMMKNLSGPAKEAVLLDLEMAPSPQQPIQTFPTTTTTEVSSSTTTNKSGGVPHTVFL